MPKDRRAYYKQWRTKNKEHVKNYIENKYEDYALHMGQERLSNPIRFLLSGAKSRAKKKGLDFNIDKSDINVPIVCSILGIPIIKEYKKGTKGGPTSNSPSLDRIDNLKGYVKGNVRVISHKANTMKHNATPEELIKFALWVFATYGKDIYEIRKIS
jgi:hypothetical protein